VYTVRGGGPAVVTLRMRAPHACSCRSASSHARTSRSTTTPFERPPVLTSSGGEQSLQPQFPHRASAGTSTGDIVPQMTRYSLHVVHCSALRVALSAGGTGDEIGARALRGIFARRPRGGELGPHSASHANGAQTSHDNAQETRNVLRVQRCRLPVEVTSMQLISTNAQNAAAYALGNGATV
jgi:hypothetical protein